jgi:hypothetical protein
MSRVFKILAVVWASILAVSIAVGAVAIILTEGFGEFFAVFSPFNIWNWGLVFILALPAIGLMKLADRFGSRPVSNYAPLKIPPVVTQRDFPPDEFSEPVRWLVVTKTARGVEDFQDVIARSGSEARRIVAQRTPIGNLVIEATRY